MDLELSRIVTQLAREEFEKARRDIPFFIHSRGITSLFHFTDIQNLESIFVHGLLGREELTKRGLDFRVSDLNRKDPILNGICVSISKPNDYMLARKRTHGWKLALLELKPPEEILSNHLFVCSPGNFGRNDHRNRILNWPEEYLGGFGLLNLFLNENLRQRYSLGKEEPTDPQAEIIFLESISSSFVSKVILPREPDVSDEFSVSDLLKRIPVGVVVESQNLKMFPSMDWKDQKRLTEFAERKWSEEWTLN